MDYRVRGSWPIKKRKPYIRFMHRESTKLWVLGLSLAGLILASVRSDWFPEMFMYYEQPVYVGYDDDDDGWYDDDDDGLQRKRRRKIRHP